MRQPRLQREIGNTQHEQDKKCANPHCPGETNFGNQSSNHDGEDDSAQTRSCSCDAEGESTTFGEPGTGGVNGGVEDCACADGAADALCEKKLVILSREGCHHQAKNVENCAEEEDPTWAVAVKHCSEYGALWEMLEWGLQMESESNLRTQKNIMKVSSEVIHVIVLVENSRSW